MRSSTKITGVIFLMGLFGGGMYYAGQQEGLSLIQQAKVQEIQQTPEKKVNVPEKIEKPETLSEKPHQPPGIRYTFFEVLDDPGMKSYVDLEGEVVQASLNARIPQAPVLKKSDSPKPIRQAIRTEKKSKQKDAPLQKANSPVKKTTDQPKERLSKTIAALSAVAALGNGPDHWVQVASFQDKERAGGLKAELRKKGFPSFLKSKSVPEKGTWYRVYLGSYNTRSDAEIAAAKMEKDTRLKPMIVRPD